MADGEPTLISRRELLARGGIYGGMLLLTSPRFPLPRAAEAANASTAHEVLTEREWTLVDSIAARILPSDDGPGAREAGCVNFIDKALAHEEKASVTLYRSGLVLVERAAEARHGTSFTALDPIAQDELLIAMQAGTIEPWSREGPAPADLFEKIRVHTIYGFLADPKYGGNRGYTGWKHVGYPGPRHHAGGYTAEQMAGTEPIETAWGEKI